MSRRSEQKLQAERAARVIRRRRWLIACLTLLLAVGLIWQADDWLDLRVKKIQVEGELTAAERNAVSQAIAQALDESGASGLHSLSLAQVRNAVASLSWADRVSARRRWPDTLVVRLSKHSVVARWGGGGYVATNGQVIDPDS